MVFIIINSYLVNTVSFIKKIINLFIQLGNEKMAKHPLIKAALTNN